MLTLPIPPSVNRLRRFTGKRKGMPDEKLVKWKYKARDIVRDMKPFPLFDNNVHITYKFYFEDRRAGDCNNYTKATTDFLIECKLLKDDRHTILKSEHVLFAGYDKENPRLEISLECIT